MPNTENIHEGHRSRLRKRYINEGGIDSFEANQILELLLFYSYHARMDTNGVAHKILNAFNGSLIDVFKASPHELMNKCGLSEKVAVQLSLISDLAEYYIKMTSSAPKYLDTLEKVQNHAKSLFTKPAVSSETFHIICLGARKIHLKNINLGTSKADSVEVTMKDVVEKVLMAEAVYIVLTHNHPNEYCKPSNADIATTAAIKNYVEPLGVKVLDHIIVCKDECFSFAAHKLCGMKLKSTINNSY